MTQQNAFSRSHAMMAAIVKIMALPGAQQITQLAALGEYTSRGHGGKHKPKGRFLGNNYRYNRSKYSPHQGKKECARRVAASQI